MDDLQIIELYNQRDETAIRETDIKYGRYCFGIAYNILSDAQDAQECVNDTWLKTWNSIPPQKPNCLKLFLAKIARNLSLDCYKKKHREKRGGGEIALALEEVDAFLAGSTDVSSELEQKEFMQTLNRFLRTLPERECNIFIRRYFYMASTAEIAEKYGLREGNVRMILSRTRKKLKNLLEREGYMI